eukprot:4412-Heterococcus_DN1.PRE.2
MAAFAWLVERSLARRIQHKQAQFGVTDIFFIFAETLAWLCCPDAAPPMMLQPPISPLRRQLAEAETDLCIFGAQSQLLHAQQPQQPSSARRFSSIKATVVASSSSARRCSAPTVLTHKETQLPALAAVRSACEATVAAAYPRSKKLLRKRSSSAAAGVRRHQAEATTQTSAAVVAVKSSAAPYVVLRGDTKPVRRVTSPSAARIPTCNTDAAVVIKHTAAPPCSTADQARALQRLVDYKRRLAEERALALAQLAAAAATKYTDADLAALRRTAAERAAAVLKESQARALDAVTDEGSRRRAAAADRASAAEAKARRRAEIYAVNALCKAKFNADFAEYSAKRQAEADAAHKALAAAALTVDANVNGSAATGGSCCVLQEADSAREAVD